MTYQELVEKLAAEAVLPEDHVRHLLEVFPDVLREGLKDGEHVRTPLGVFTKKTRKAMSVTDPTGAVVKVPPARSVKLRSGTRLKHA